MYIQAGGHSSTDLVCGAYEEIQIREHRWEQDQEQKAACNYKVDQQWRVIGSALLTDQDDELQCGLLSFNTLQRVHPLHSMKLEADRFSNHFSS